MRKITSDKRGVIPIVLIVIGVLLILYLLLYLPIPSFKKIKAIVNYFSIFILFLAIQVGIIYGYYKLGTYVTKGIMFYNKSILNLTTRIKQNIERSSMM